MLKVTITTGPSAVTIQDPRAVTQANTEQAVLYVPGSTTKSFTMQFNQLERIRTQLDAAVAQGLCSFVLANAESGYAEQPDAPDSPIITAVNDSTLTAASQALLIYGKHLDGYGTVATASIPGDTTAGSVALKSVQPAALGNKYAVKVIDSGSGGLSRTFTLVDGLYVLSINLGASTAVTVTSLVASLNDPASPVYGIMRAAAVGTGSTPITAVHAQTQFTGGKGIGLSVAIAGLPATIVDSTATLLTLATPVLTPLSLSSGAALNIHVNSNGKITSACVTLV